NRRRKLLDSVSRHRKRLLRHAYDSSEQSHDGRRSDQPVQSVDELLRHRPKHTQFHPYSGVLPCPPKSLTIAESGPCGPAYSTVSVSSKVPSGRRVVVRVVLFMLPVATRYMP